MRGGGDREEKRKKEDGLMGSLSLMGGVDKSNFEGAKWFGVAASARFDSSFGTGLDTRRDIVKCLFEGTQASRIAASVVSSDEIGSPSVGGLALGSYWQMLLGPRRGESTTMFSCLSTSTRSNSWLRPIAENLEKARVGTICDGARGFLTSEIARGACCETEELVEVVEEMRRLVDVYDEE